MPSILVMKDLKDLKAFKLPRKRHRGTFPVLPDVVMVRVAEHATGHRLQQSLETRGDPALDPVLLGIVPLLAVCQKWRAQLAPAFYRHAFVALDLPEDNQPLSTHPAHDAKSMAKLGHDRFVRRLMIMVDSSIFTNTDSMVAMEDILLPDRFAGASDIILNFDGTGWDEACRVPDIADLVQRLSDQINKTVPNATSFALVSPNYLHLGTDSVATALLCSVARNKTSFGIDYPALQLSRFANRNALVYLTNITVSRRTRWTEILVHIVQFNAPTLQTLQLGEVSGEDFDRLLFASDGQAIIYLTLWKLELHVTSMPIIGRPSLVYAPFPSLTHFDNSNIHPFIDDTILRYNRLNLRFLRMPLDPILLEQLASANAFNPKLYPSLTRIELEYEGGQSMLCNGPNIYNMLVSAFNMAQTAYVVKLKMHDIQSSAVLPYLKSSSTLRTLYAPGLNVNLTHLNQLLQNYPNLASLACTFVDEIEGIVGDSPNTRFIRFMRKGCTIKTKLRILEMVNVAPDQDIKRAGHVVALLASLMPSLKRIILRPAKEIHPRCLLRSAVKAKKKLVYKDLPHFKALRFEACSPDQPSTVTQ